MKILIVSNTFSKNEGGATAIAFEQAKALREKGFDVFVFAGSFDDDSLGWQKESDLHVFKIKIKNTARYIFRSWSSMRNFRIEKEFKRFLKDKDFDVIHFHNLYYQMPFSLIKIARKNCHKVFFTAHDVMTFSPQKLNFFVDEKLTLENIDKVDYKFSFWRHLRQEKKAFNPFRNFYIKQCLKKINKIFCVSHELEKALNQNKILNTTTIHNGIDAEDWIANSDQVKRIRKKFNLENKKILLFAGRLSGQKGGNIVLEVLSKVKQKIPNMALLLLGGDEKYFESIAKKIKNLNLEKNIILAGKVSRQEMKEYYALVNLVLVPSLCLDPFPTVNLESLACGTPVIATIFGGSREVVKHQKNGFLINPLDIDDFSNKVISFFDNIDSKINTKDLESFSREKWINQIISFY
jgi:glycosyltransferase involved in cell wall biosynthesis